MSIKSINPYNEEVLETFERFSNAKVAACLEKSQESFNHWRKTDFAHRSGLMKRLADILEVDKTKLAETITLEMGKPIREALAEVEKCAWVCRFYADHAESFLKDEIIDTEASKSWVQYQPLGPVLAIMPWNFPLWQVFRFAAPGLMAGNVGLLKHASNVTRCALNIEDAFKQADFPEGAFQSLIVDSDQVKGIIESNVVKAVTLTGSEKAGASVASIAGENIKKSVLELGGSNAFIVLDDANLNEAVDIAIKSRFQNAGQSCIAAKRFIVLKSVYDGFLVKFVDGVKNLKAGDPMDSNTDIGPLARVDLATELDEQVKSSLNKGAKLVIGGEQQRARYSPAVLTHVTPDMPAFREELFGPVAPVIKVKNENEALELANRSSFGLGATVCTTDLDRAQKFIDGIEDGAVFINALVKSDPRLPFGGTKRSGFGRELSHHGIREFTNIKTVFIK